MNKNHAKTEKLFARLKFWQQMMIVMGASSLIGMCLDVNGSMHRADAETLVFLTYAACVISWAISLWYSVSLDKWMEDQ